MILCDINVLLYAFREDAVNHAAYREWLETELSSDRAFGVCDQILAGFIRIATHPRIFNPPTPLEEALGFVSEIRGLPNAVPVSAGPRHWDIFDSLCRAANAKGNLVPDAWFAALAIECGLEWISTDRDYARFQGLKWRHPLNN